MRLGLSDSYSLSNEFLNDVLQRDNTDSAAGLGWEVGHEYHMRLAFLEEVEDIQAARLGAGFGERGEGKVAHAQGVLGVVGDEHLDKQHANKVVLVAGIVNRNARVPSREDIIHHLLVQDGVGRHGEDVLHGRHDVAHSLGL